jgi:DHA1 family tetracycline resistance protein-like MFS transporter
VLYTSFKFGWGPEQNGWSLAAVGMMSALVQGLLLRLLLRRFSPRRLAVAGLVSSTLAYAAWGAVSQGWMMYAVIACNVLGYTVVASIQSVISAAAGPERQGQTMGAVNSLNSLMAVAAPIFSTPLLAAISQLPPADWRLGTPLYFCAALQAGAMAMAFLHFRRQRALALPAGAA